MEAVRSDQYPELANTTHQMRREYLQMVGKCQKAGILQGDSPQEVLQVMWASTHGAAMLVIDGFIQADDVEAFAEDIVTRVQDGIRRR